MKATTLVLDGIGAIVLGVLLAFTPLLNILLGWWLAPLLIAGGVVAIVWSILFPLWEILRMTLRFGICQVFREEAQGRPSVHRVIVNEKVWQLLGGGSCYSRIQREAA